MQQGWRVGIGYDIHRLVDARPLILGGIRIDFPRGLLAHSDGDAVLHAITDALLGAAGLPDIGETFPDSDPAYRGIDSAILLTESLRRVETTGLKVQNVDVVVHAELPKLGPYKKAMAERIAGLLGLERGSVSVKAKTNEGLGPIGEGEAIACTAVVMISTAE